jgi:hypothetical protein
MAAGQHAAAVQAKQHSLGKPKHVSCRTPVQVFATAAAAQPSAWLDVTCLLNISGHYSSSYSVPANEQHCHALCKTYTEVKLI